MTRVHMKQNTFSILSRVYFSKFKIFEIIYDQKFSNNFSFCLNRVQQMNFKDAKKYFELALNLSIKWFGPSHANTSKIYHYFGCFFSLQEMEL
jgi:hypothetical protein